jgi:hypothetical protein
LAGGSGGDTKRVRYREKEGRKEEGGEVTNNKIATRTQRIEIFNSFQQKEDSPLQEEASSRGR